MLIFVLEEQIYHTQHLNMDLRNQTLKLVITEGRIVLHKNGLYTSKYGVNRSIIHVFFKIFQFQIYRICWL